MDTKGFLGVGLKFPLQIDKKSGKLALSRYEENIRENIGIILRTYPGERVMRAGFGYNSSGILFRGGTAVSAFPNQQLVEQLTIQEPRIKDISVDIELSGEDNNYLLIKIEYTVRDTNNRYSHVYPYYMTEGNKEVSII